MWKEGSKRKRKKWLIVANAERLLLQNKNVQPPVKTHKNDVGMQPNTLQYATHHNYRLKGLRIEADCFDKSACRDHRERCGQSKALKRSLSR